MRASTTETSSTRVPPTNARHAAARSPSWAARGLPVLVLSLPGLVGCDLIASAKATTIVAGILIATPAVSLSGQLELESEVVATTFLGERASATSTEEPEPITGADVSVQFAGNEIALMEQADPRGFYETDSIQSMGLEYADGQTYVFTAKLPGDTVEFGGSVTAPTQLQNASLTFTPELGALAMVADVKTHPKNTDLTVAWTAQNGRYAYVTVVRADPMKPDQPEIVFDNRPQTGGEIVKFILGTPPTSITIPGSTFADDAAYAVIVVTMNKGDPRTNTSLASPILAGSGAAVVIAVGDFRP